MKQNSLSTEAFESTYALLVRSEEKERNMFEGAAYLVFIVSAVLSIWHAAQQPVPLPRSIQTTSIMHCTDTHQG